MKEQSEDKEDLLLREQMRKGKFHQEAKRVLDRINYDTERGKQALSRSYRRMSKVVEEVKKDRFNFNEQINLIDDVLQCAFFYQPFPIENAEIQFGTTFAFEAFRANRRLKPPAIQVDQQIVKPQQKIVQVGASKSSCTYKFESQPHSTVVFTNIPNIHPLIMNETIHKYLNPPPGTYQMGKNPYFISYQPQDSTHAGMFTRISVLAVSETKIASKLVSVSVMSTSEVAQIQSMNYNAQRPPDSFPFEQSSLGGDSFSNNSFNNNIFQEEEEEYDQEA